ncbi:MAG: amidohydrolase [Erysipelotrichaceae bacterium]|nr:amidohydrolase [Erysipelotrichaceae bacterium]MDY5251385.1 amidohydrolase [Erysipelotrichaceae bacterium]
MIKAIINANIYGSKFHNIIYDDNSIIYIGDDISKFVVDESIDACGMSVYPGFYDSHMHLLGLGFYLSNIDLKDCKSFEDIKHLLSTRINDDKYPWIIARGFNEDKLKEKRLITKKELDEICDDKPICLTRCCGHIMVCNSKALQRSGFDQDIKANGYAVDIESGLVSENAIEDVKMAWPLETVKSISEYIMLACKKCNEYGITAVGSDDFISITSEYDEVLEAFEKLAFQQKLTLRVNEQAHFNTIEDFQRFLHDGYTYDVGNDYFRIGPLKLIMDGSLGARTAYLSQKYADDPSTNGFNCLSAKELEAYMSLAQYYNMPFAIHVIGDKALDMVLDVYDKVKIEHNILPNGLVHVQITRPEQLQRIIDNKLHCYIQSIFIDYDGTILKQRVGKLADSSYAFKTLYENTTVSNGSDCPVEMPDVIKGIDKAVNRCDANGVPLNPQEALSVKQAIDSFTINGYKTSLEDNDKGKIAVGFKPDFVILDQNLETIPKDKIIDTKVIMTIFDGEVVYDRYQDR